MNVLLIALAVGFGFLRVRYGRPSWLIVAGLGTLGLFPELGLVVLFIVMAWFLLREWGKLPGKKSK